MLQDFDFGGLFLPSFRFTWSGISPELRFPHTSVQQAELSFLTRHRFLYLIPTLVPQLVK